MAVAEEEPYVSKRDERYHQSQLVAHWTIVFLVLMQFLFNGQMQQDFARAVDLGFMPPSGGVWTHGLGGTIILIAMIWRLGMRRHYGAPPPPDTEPKAIQLVSRGVHYAFYVFLIGMPLAGMLALWTLDPTIGWLHGLASKILLALIALHFAGAMWHAFKKDGVVKRMLRRNPADRASI